MHKARNNIRARICIHYLPHRPLFRRFRRHDELRNSWRKKSSSTHSFSPIDATEDDCMAFGLGAGVSIVFGGIRCVAWCFPFATSQERWTWRISAVLVSGLPIAIIAALWFFPKDENRTMWIDLYEIFMLCIWMVMICLYITARISLLVVPFLGLRPLPPDAYVELNWISFLPHI